MPIPDIWNDYSTLYAHPAALFTYLSELNEMLIGLAGVLYVRFNAMLFDQQVAMPAGIN